MKQSKLWKWAVGLVVAITLIVDFLWTKTGIALAIPAALLIKEDDSEEVKQAKKALNEAKDEAVKEATEKLKGELDSAKSKAEAAESKVKDLEGKNTELEKNQKEQQKHLDELTAKVNTNGSGQKKSMKAALREICEEIAKSVREKKLGGSEVREFSMKALSEDNINGLSFTGDEDGSGPVIAPFREAGVAKEPKRRPFIRNLAFNGTTTSDTVSWTEKVDENGMPIALGEEDAYPLQNTSYEQFSVSVKKIGATTKATEEKLMDVNWLMNEIQSELIERQDLVVDGKIFNGDGIGNNPKGVYQYAVAFAAGAFAGAVPNANRTDVLRIAYNQIIKANFYPTAIVLNPDDVTFMELQKDANGQYIMPPFTAADGTKVKGVPVIENTGVTTDDFLIGDFNRLGVFSREAPTIEVGRDGTDFSHDLKTIKLRERLAVRVKGAHTKAFVKGNFTTALAAITPAEPEEEEGA